jgi:hypothetical protein
MLENPSLRPSIAQIYSDWPWQRPQDYGQGLGHRTVLPFRIYRTRIRVTVCCGYVLCDLRVANGCIQCCLDPDPDLWIC